MKKRFYLTGVLMISGMVSAATAVTEDFDWGTGVSGRESIASGQNINGVAVSGCDTVSWTGSSSANASAKFSGTAGAGNGKVTLAGGATNAIIRFPYTADWANEVITATAVGTFTPGSAGTRRFVIGFQQASASGSTILGAGSFDSISADINHAGKIVLKVRFYNKENEDYTLTDANSFPAFTSGGTVSHQLTVDGPNKKVTLITTTKAGSVTNTVDFSAAKRALNLGFFAVNSRIGTVELDSVSVGLKKD